MKSPDAVGRSEYRKSNNYAGRGYAAQETRTAGGTQATPKGLPKVITSLCPECRKRIQATLYQRENRVYMLKACCEHGEFRDLISSDAKFYLKMERWTFEDEGGILNPNVQGITSCPEGCGLCRGHLATACQVNIDLTNRCNMNCPFCFASANASGRFFQASRDQIELMLQTARRVEPRRNKTVQFSGGEPTIHSDFMWAVGRAKAIGFKYVMAATNGLTIAASREFAERCREAGLDALYLQFDGVTDDVYRQTRGRPLAGQKQRAVENARAAGLRVVLVPTVVRGVNDHQIGSIIRFGLRNLDVVNGISFQPVSFTGRISFEKLASQRFTMADLAQAIKEQTGYLEPYRDWYPLSFVSPLSRLMEKISGRPTMTISCHSDCGVGAYVISDGNGTVIPITKFVDMESAMMDLAAMSRRDVSLLEKPVFLVQFYKAIKRHYLGNELPEDFRFFDFLGALGPTLIRKASHLGKRREWKFLIILSMHFQDLYNFNLDRVRRCNVHYAAPDGLLYPFCTYNSGPTYRTVIEEKFSRPLRG
jgi:uncharacterized radical SAM superfamily Fe-S cluster-containing enzyme